MPTADLETTAILGHRQPTLDSLSVVVYAPCFPGVL